jgi:predicted ATPase
VSLAELSAVKDVGFAFHRALSRLTEMQSAAYADEHARRHRRASTSIHNNYN